MLGYGLAGAAVRNSVDYFSPPRSMTYRLWAHPKRAQNPS
jgi:hypothetical protein